MIVDLTGSNADYTLPAGQTLAVNFGLGSDETAVLYYHIGPGETSHVTIAGTMNLIADATEPNSDTESGGSGADIFHGSQDAGIDKVLDFHLAEGDRVMLDPGTTFTVTQVGADTVIDMGPGSNGAPNQMILVGVQMSTLTPGWIFGA